MPAQPSSALDPGAPALPPGVEIGPARWGELRAVERLQRRAFRPRLAYRMPTLVLLRVWPGGRFLVARLAGGVLGCAIGDRHEGASRVVNLAVDPAARRLGIGGALLAALEAALPEGDMVLMVEAGNAAAIALYERAGYAAAGREATYYGPGRPGIWMRKERAAPAARPARR